MPADREEIKCLLEEGIDVVELAGPQKLVTSNGKLRGLVCRRMEYRGDRDASGRKIPQEVPGSDFEVALDTLILAISQHAILDFFDGEPVAVNSSGYIEADPLTFETSVPGVYAGGDVANRGPSSIVEAAADGKAIARSILHRHRAGAEPSPVGSFNTAALLRRRSHREWRVPVPHSPVAERKNFNEVVLGYSGQQARLEAARCLDCNTYCSLCVGVCPNLALQTVQVEPGETSGIKQAYQIVVLTDLCNECGNCTTFCPTAGEPYRDKPRLYLDRAEFEAQQENAFMVFRETGTGKSEKWTMDARWAGETHQIEDIETDGEAAHFSIEPYAAMRLLLQGLRQSMPHLPTACSAASSRAWPAPTGKNSGPEYEDTL